jgi:hypothetical protein
VACAENDGPEFFRQSKELAAKLSTPLLVGKDMNHFEIAESLADRDSALARAVLGMLA